MDGKGGRGEDDQARHVITTLIGFRLQRGAVELRVKTSASIHMPAPDPLSFLFRELLQSPKPRELAGVLLGHGVPLLHCYQKSRLLRFVYLQLPLYRRHFATLFNQLLAHDNKALGAFQTQLELFCVALGLGGIGLRSL